MQNYHELLQHILDNGTDKTDRTGTGTRSVFGYQLRYDLSKGFPLVTTKKVHLKSIVYELLWFLKGDRDLRFVGSRPESGSLLSGESACPSPSAPPPIRALLRALSLSNKLIN